MSLFGQCKKEIILLTGSSFSSIQTVKKSLENHYEIVVVSSEDELLEQAEKGPHIILLELALPSIGGYELCRKLKTNVSTRDIAIIFLTNTINSQIEEAMFQAGASDYLLTPINAIVLENKLARHSQLNELALFFSNQEEMLSREIARRNAKTNATQYATILTLASLAENRDDSTGDHIVRTQNYVQSLASSLQKNDRFKKALPDSAIDLICKAAPLHDIGKVAIPDNILLKPGKLTDEEYDIMKMHTLIAKVAIENAEKTSRQWVDKPSSFLQYAKDIAFYHHERWSGGGYPLNISGEEIPLVARIMAVADVYDALVSPRIYKTACSHETAVKIIMSESGKQFDPDIVTAFISVATNFKEIAEKYHDSDIHKLDH